MRKLLSPPTIVFKGSGWARKESHIGGGSADRSNGNGDTVQGAKPSTGPGSSEGSSGGSGDGAASTSSPAAAGESR
jgi:hypothetical protein